MKISDLKSLKKYIEDKIKLFPTMGKTLNEIEKNLLDLFKTEATYMLPPKVASTFQKYKDCYMALEAIKKEVSQKIEEAEKNKQEEIPYELPKNFVKNYNLLPILQSNFEITCQSSYRNKYAPNQLAVTDKEKTLFIFEPKDFSKAIQPYTEQVEKILEIMSGPFDLNSKNQQLSAETQDILVAPYMMNRGFARDSYSTYFQDQTKNIIYANRDITHNEANIRLEDFISLYLQKSKLPAEIRPHLKALITTLCYQSGLTAVASELIMEFTSFNYIDPNNANKYINTRPFSGSTFMQQVYFDEKFRLHIENYCSENKQITGAGEFNMPYEKRLTTTINVNVNNNIPHFKLEKFEFSYMAYVPKTTKSQLLINPLFLSGKKNIDKNHLDLSRPLLENLAKFCGYQSLKQFANVNKSSIHVIQFDKDCIHELFAKKEKKLGLTSIETEFFIKLHDVLSKKDTQKPEIFKMISDFIDNQLPKLSDADKLRYIYLLKMADNLGGSKTKEIQDIYVKFVNSFKNVDTLIKAAKTDMMFYETYKKEAPSFLSSLPKLSDKDHLAIMRQLKTEHMALIVQNPELLIHKEQTILYKQFLKNLTFEEKIGFLSKYATNTKDCLHYLDENFFPDETVQYEYGKQMKSQGEKSNIFEPLTQLMLNGNLDTISAIKEKIPALFIDYNSTWACSLSSINERIEIVQMHAASIEKRFGNLFLLLLVDDLKNAVAAATSSELLLNLSEANAILNSILSEMSGYTEITDQLETIQLETTKKMQACYQQEKLEETEEITESEESKTEELVSAILTKLKGKEEQEKGKKPDGGQEGQSVGLRHS